MKVERRDKPPAGGALAGERPRVIVSSDIGGSDPDDFQSMVHLLVYSDVLDIEGLISSPPHGGRARHIVEVLDAYAADHPRLRRHARTYPTPAQLGRVVKQGATSPAPQAGFDLQTEGSNWIVERARARDERPLYVLVWGSITDIAQAVHDAAEIKERIRVYAIGSWNTRNDRAARDYLWNHHVDLWWIESDTTFRGMYIGGEQSGEWGNREFLRRHVRAHGALGDLLFEKKRDLKMGDSPSVLYMLRGKPGDPGGESWGGSYRRPKPDRRPRYWTDRQEPELAEGDRHGAKTVNRWRVAFLDDWRKRMDRLLQT